MSGSTSSPTPTTATRSASGSSPTPTTRWTPRTSSRSAGRSSSPPTGARSSVPPNLVQVSFDDQPADDAFYGDLRQLDVTAELDGGTSFALRLAIELDDAGQWTYTDDDRLALFARVDVGIGFGGDPAALGTGGGPEPVATCYVTGASVHLGAETGDATLEVKGRDATVLLGLEEKTGAWPDMADSDIASQIVGDYGLSTAAAPRAPGRQGAETLVPPRGSDADSVRALARRNGYEFWLDPSGPGGFYFGPPRLDGTPLPDLAVRFGEASNLVSFDVHVAGDRPLAVRAEQLDARSKEEITADVTDSQLAPLGAESLPDLVEGRLGALVTPADEQGLLRLLAQPTADPSELQAAAQAVRDEAGWLVRAAGEANTEAYATVLRPGRVVQVNGAGRRHSGRYYVTRVVHRLAGGIYRQTFEARRNASLLDGAESFGAGADGIGLPVGP